MSKNALMDRVHEKLIAEANRDEVAFLNRISKELADIIGHNESRHIYEAIAKANCAGSANHFTLPNGFRTALQYGFYVKRREAWLSRVEGLREYFE